MTEAQSVTKQPLVHYTAPKADMHCHISMADNPESFIKRAKADGHDISILTNREARYYRDLPQFHHLYESLRSKRMRGQEHAAVTQHYLERIAREGAIYAEISYSFREPKRFAEGLPAIIEGMKVAKHNTGIESRIVVTVLRDHGPEMAEQAATYLAKNPSDYVTGFGLVGDESVNRLSEYSRAFRIAWDEAVLGLTPHVAEQHPQNAADFLAAIPREAFDVDEKDTRRVRAGHGTLIHMNDSLMAIFKEMALCLEVCLSANNRIDLPEVVRNLRVGDAFDARIPESLLVDRPALSYFKDLKNHPLVMFLQRGILCALGSDNPFLMNTNIGKEYSLAVKATGMSEADTLHFTKAAIKNANVDWKTRQKLYGYIKSYEQQIAQTGQRPKTTALGYMHAEV